MRFAVTLAAAAALLGLAAAPALAHGGQYRGPGGRTPADPTPGTTPPTTTADWEAWWTANAWRYINLRERLRQRDRGTGETRGTGLGAHAGADDLVSGDDQGDPRAFFETQVLPVLTDALKDPDAEVRSAATIALAKLGFPRSVIDLNRALRDDARDVRDGAVLGLGMLGDPLAAGVLETVLLDPRQADRTRSFAAIGLGLIGGEEGAGPLMAFLDPATDAKRQGGIQRSAHTEASALTGLGMSRFGNAAAGLRKDYASGSRYEPAVRSFAGVALARLRDRPSIPFLLQGLAHDREPMRQSAALALGVLASPEDGEVIAALAKRLWEEKDINTRQFALMSLARIGGPEARAAVRKYLEKGAKIDVPLAALACAIGEDPEALPAVRKLFRDERQPSVKGGYALALGLYGDQEMVDEIKRLALAQGDTGIRNACLTALGLLRVDSCADEVRALVDTENDPSVRLAAATCLGLLQDRGVVEVLERLAKDGDNVFVRSGACRLLGNVGAPRSAKTLIAIVRDPKDNSVVRMTATAALGSLGDPNLIPLLAQVGLDNNYASAVDPLIEIATML
jgi:HEAT repeat protein